MVSALVFSNKLHGKRYFPSEIFASLCLIWQFCPSHEILWHGFRCGSEQLISGWKMRYLGYLRQTILIFVVIPDWRSVTRVIKWSPVVQIRMFVILGAPRRAPLEPLGTALPWFSKKKASMIMRGAFLLGKLYAWLLKRFQHSEWSHLRMSGSWMLDFVAKPACDIMRLL